MKSFQGLTYMGAVLSLAGTAMANANTCAVNVENNDFNSDTSQWVRLGNHSSAFQYDSGSQAAKLVRQSTSNAWEFQGAYQTVSSALVTGQSYTLSITQKKSQSSNLKIWARLGGGTPVEITPAAVNQWQTDSYTLESGGGEKIEFYTTHGGAGNTYLFDDVAMSIEGCSNPTNPSQEGWTDWLNRDGNGGTGDWERLWDHNVMSSAGICPHPIDVQARTVSGQVDVSQTGENVVFGTPYGLSCSNSSQANGGCSNYEVRFLCPLSNAQPSTDDWTAWLIRDDNDGNGVTALLADFSELQVPCNSDGALAIEARTLTGLSPAEAGETVHMDVQTGFVCNNSEQSDGKCENYEVRFQCSASTPATNMVAEGISLDELFIQRDRANGNDSTYTSIESQLGDWSRIESFTQTLMSDHGGVISATSAPVAGSSDARLNFWNGPVAGYTTGSTSQYWDGVGLIPKQAQATATTHDGKACSSTAYNCQDAFRVSDNLLSAAYFSLVKDDALVREVVKKALLRQTNTSLAPGVDFSNRNRWPVNNDAAHQNPFFFTASWVTKIARMYDYTKTRVDSNGVAYQNVYSAAEKQQIENWLKNAGEYYREVVEFVVIGQFYNHPKAHSSETAAETYANNINHRIAQNPVRGANGVDRTQYSNSSYRYWDNGPLPTGSQLQLQNRITDSATAFCVVGVMLDEEKMKRDCKLFFKEVIAYGMDAQGHLGDFYRAKSRGGYEAGEEMGVHYVVGQLAHLIEIADLFARIGDNSLYEYSTVEGAEVYQHGQTSSTKGGPKSLYLGLVRTAQFLKDQGVVYNGSVVTEAGHVINGVTPMAGGSSTITKYMQHQTTWAQANVYYQQQELADAIYSNTAAGYHGWKVWWQTINNGYISDTSRGTFGVSVGQQLLYGKLEGRVWPYPNINEQEVINTQR